jgi:hypothetical protein
MEGAFSMARTKKKDRWAGLDAHRPYPWKEPTRCIFCGIDGVTTPLGRLTREHVFSDGTRRFVPQSTNSYISLRATAYLDHTQYIEVPRHGDIRDWQVRCVCAKCNNGWMRTKVDECARPILTSLIKGQQVRVSASDQIKVATWATLKAMVAEFAESECVTTHHMQRRRLLLRQLPPLHGWAVWIAHYVRKEWLPSWISIPFLVFLTDLPLCTQIDGLPTTIAMQPRKLSASSLFMSYVLRSPMPGFAAPKWKFNIPRGQLLFRIWPPTDASIIWTAGTITDRTADYIAGAVKEFMAKTASGG